MIRVLPFILYLWLIALHQVIMRDGTAIYSAEINLPALLVLIVAIYKSELASVWFGLAAGLVTAAGEPALLGWQALAMAVLGIAAFHVHKRLNVESLYAKLLLIVGGVFLHNLFSILVRGGEGFFFLLLASAFPGAVYTMIIAWVFFLFKEKKITFQKVKAIF
jgi:rod shape-determining protein MreD